MWVPPWELISEAFGLVLMLRQVRKVSLRPYSGSAEPQGEREGIYPEQSERMSGRDSKPGYGLEAIMTCGDTNIDEMLQTSRPPHC
jgi:hypothetical protein